MCLWYSLVTKRCHLDSSSRESLELASRVTPCELKADASRPPQPQVTRHPAPLLPLSPLSYTYLSCLFVCRVESRRASGQGRDGREADLSSSRRELPCDPKRSRDKSGGVGCLETVAKCKGRPWSTAVVFAQASTANGRRVQRIAQPRPSCRSDVFLLPRVAAARVGRHPG